MSVVLVPDREIKRLNKRYRGVDRVTDVLSFRLSASEEPLGGEIYIARERSKRQAREQRHSWNDELGYLAMHGVLHLYGYTDYTARTRRRMIALQDRLWASLSSSV